MLQLYSSNHNDNNENKKIALVVTLISLEIPTESLIITTSLLSVKGNKRMCFCAGSPLVSTQFFCSLGMVMHDNEAESKEN